MENGSPELKIFPENDLDDDTNAVIEIHPMFIDGVKSTAVNSNKGKNNDAETDIETMPTIKETILKTALTDIETMATGKETDIETASTDIETAEDASAPEKLILELIRSNPKITIIQISEKIGTLSVSGIRYHIKALKDRGILFRKGSTKAGEWVIADVNPNVE